MSSSSRKRSLGATSPSFSDDEGEEDTDGQPLFQLSLAYEGELQRFSLDRALSVDAEYKQHITAVVVQVQQVLYDSAGYLLVSADSLTSAQATKKDLFYLISALPCPSLREALIEANSSSRLAYDGFMTIVFYSILTTDRHAITCQDLLHNIRKIESRFPDRLVSKSQRTAAPVAELEDSFLDLLERMQKEGYVTMVADEIEPAEVAKRTVHFGPRFHLEVGLQKLLLSYYRFTNQPVDENSIKQAGRGARDEEEEEESD
eukprot:scaffold249_cov109-Ochromonas_danica.AAC.6